MNKPTYIRKNEALVENWIDDTPTHGIEDRYVRAVLSSMLAESRNPNHRDYTGPMTIELCEKWLAGEREAACVIGTESDVLRSASAVLCSASAAVLACLRDKLYPAD